MHVYIHYTNAVTEQQGYDLIAASFSGDGEELWDKVSYKPLVHFDWDYRNEDFLEKLFRIFNYEDLDYGPSDFGAEGCRSMSVGDIIITTICGRHAAWRCENSGWSLLWTQEEGEITWPQES